MCIEIYTKWKPAFDKLATIEKGQLLELLLLWAGDEKAELPAPISDRVAIMFEMLKAENE
jgi:hypothetical protein